MVSTINNYSTQTNQLNNCPPVGWKDRDTRIQQLIDESFKVRVLPLHEKMFDGTCWNYLYVGSENYTFEDREMSACGQSALKLAEEFSNQDSFDVLDLGTGNGRFLKSLKDRFNNVNVIGVSAADFRTTNYAKKEFKIPDEEYIVGNIENLISLPSLQGKKFDFIVSHVTFRHLSDPIGVICQSYELLKQNGLMILDDFNLNGITGDEYVNAFEKGGCHSVQIFPEACFIINDIAIRTLEKPLTTVIRKTTEHLDLPIYYDVERSTKADSDNQAHIFYKV